jgi:hypothetical protein
VRLSRSRLAVIVVGLSIVSGAAAGLIVALILDATTGGLFNRTLDNVLYGFGAVSGAALGAVLGPLAAFGFLRAVPIGRLFVQTIVGAACGGLAGLGLGLLVPQVGEGFAAVFGGAVLGFCLAAYLLWRLHRSSRQPSVPAAG